MLRSGLQVLPKGQDVYSLHQHCITRCLQKSLHAGPFPASLVCSILQGRAGWGRAGFQTLMVLRTDCGLKPVLHLVGVYSMQIARQLDFTHQAGQPDSMHHRSSQAHVLPACCKYLLNQVWLPLLQGRVSRLLVQEVKPDSMSTQPTLAVTTCHRQWGVLAVSSTCSAHTAGPARVAQSGA